MSGLPRWVPWALGAVALLGTTSVVAQRSYVGPRRGLEIQIAGLTASVKGLEKERDSLREVASRSRTLGVLTLGKKLDVVQHRFRTGLATIAEQGGLSAISVDCGASQGVVNPLVSAKGVPTNLKRELRARPGFEVVRGSVKANGSLDKVLAVLAAVGSQPWVHRVESYSIKPLGKERASYELRLEAATLIAPGWVAKESAEGPAIASTEPSADQGWRRIAARNPFVRSAAAEVSRPAVIASVTPSASDDWRLAGVMRGRRGVEAILRNQRSGEGKTLTEGEDFSGVKLVGGAAGGGADGIVIEADGKRWELSIGEALSARRPAGS
jgi:hypothetical protein